MSQYSHGESPTEGTDGAAVIRAAADASAVPRRLALLFLVSVLGLFLEVCLIRWHGTEFRAAAYFKNVTLLACFLGLGLGFALADRARSYGGWAMPLLAAHVVGLDLLSRLGIDSLVRLPHGSSQLWAWGVHAAETPNAMAAVAQGAVFYGFFLFLFLITIVVFIPIGQLTGALMNDLPPLRAYTVNILGSLGGVLLFTAVSYLWLPPAAWFALAAILGLALLRRSATNVVPSAVACVVMIAWTGSSSGFVKGGGSPHMQDIYSPYQLLELQPYHVVDADGRRLHRGMAAFANKTYHLKAEDLSRAWLAAHGARFPWAVENALAYELPYRFVDAPQRVLVVGSGAGNDVAAALRLGGSDMHLDAVEIDPAIIAIGRRHHPEAPYDDRRVRVHIGDARQFIKRCRDRYDLVVFGLVDSHTLLSGMSSLRLDNFVYTLECFAEARRLLAPGGAMAVSFSTPAMNHIGRRMYDMLRRTFPEPRPRAFRIGFDSGVLYVAGEGVGDVRNLPPAVTSSEVTDAYQTVPADEVPPPATDDWPFLYMAGRSVPTSHLGLAVTLALVAVVWVRRVNRGSGALNWHFFFLGSAFLLIEVKGIAELALVWGTTWVVNTVVISGILGFILLANWYVAAARPAETRPYYMGLAISLLAGFALPVSTWLQFGWAAAAVTSAVLLLMPLFFAGVIFAVSLKECASVRAAFASNLIGAILGGFVEYSSMALGFRALYLLALGLYAASFLVLRGSRAR